MLGDREKEKVMPLVIFCLCVAMASIIYLLIAGYSVWAALGIGYGYAALLMLLVPTAMHLYHKWAAKRSRREDEVA